MAKHEAFVWLTVLLVVAVVMYVMYYDKHGEKTDAPVHETPLKPAEHPATKLKSELEAAVRKEIAELKQKLDEAVKMCKAACAQQKMPVSECEKHCDQLRAQAVNYMRQACKNKSFKAFDYCKAKCAGNVGCTQLCDKLIDEMCAQLESELGH